MKNKNLQVSFARQLKIARKNAQREIDLQNKRVKTGDISKIVSDFYICLKHSYPLGILCLSLYDFDRVFRYKPEQLKWKTLSRLCRTARKKGMIVKPPWRHEWSSLDGDYRKIKFHTYNLTKIMQRFKRL